MIPSRTQMVSLSSRNEEDLLAAKALEAELSLHDSLSILDAQMAKWGNPFPCSSLPQASLPSLQNPETRIAVSLTSASRVTENPSCPKQRRSSPPKRIRKRPTTTTASTKKKKRPNARGQAPQTAKQSVEPTPEMQPSVSSIRSIVKSTEVATQAKPSTLISEAQASTAINQQEEIQISLVNPIHYVEKLFDESIAPILPAFGESATKKLLRVQHYRNLVSAIASNQLQERGGIVSPEDLLQISFKAFEGSGSVILS